MREQYERCLKKAWQELVQRRWARALEHLEEAQKYTTDADELATLESRIAEARTRIGRRRSAL